jgi:tetratricopeptide (TPR) repeat protein
VAKGLTGFVGRKNSLAVLMDAFEKAKKGSGQVVGVAGEAGVGKSRLLLEFRNSLPQAEFSYLEGRCIHYGSAMAYLPILGILRHYFQLEEGESDISIGRKLSDGVLKLDEKLNAIIPPFQELFSLKTVDEAFARLEPKQKKEKIFEAIRDLLIRESKDKPLVVAVEDLHWIDKTSEEFLDYLIGWLTNQKIILILLQRPEYAHNWANTSSYTRLAVNQLSLESSAELIQAILEGGRVAPELENIILKRAAGNPLFMEELTRSLLENGSIRREKDQYALTAQYSDLQIPETIQGIIAARMDRLEDNLKRTMQVASVIGREFAFRLLQAIMETRLGLESDLLDLQELEFIYEKNLFPELEYIFKHALTQEVAYNSLLLKRRKDIHKIIGKAIEELYPKRLEEFYEMLAYHYSKGEILEKAVQYLKLSGSKALRNHSVRESYHYFMEALGTLDRLPDTIEGKKERLELIVLMDTPMNHLAYPDGSLEKFQEGLNLATVLLDNKRLAFFHGRLSYYHTVKGNHAQALKYGEDAVQEGLRSRELDQIIPIMNGLCMAYMATGLFWKATDIIPPILDLIEEEGREADFFSMTINPHFFFSASYGLSLGLVGRFEEGEIQLEKGLLKAIPMNDLTGLGGFEYCYGCLSHTKGDWKCTIDHLQKATKYYAEANFLFMLASALMYLGDAHAYLGDPETGLKYLEKAINIQQDKGIGFHRSAGPLILGNIHLHMNDLEKARWYMEEAVKLCRENNEKGIEGWASTWLGRVLGQMGEIDRAEETIRHGMELTNVLKMKPYYILGYYSLGEVYAHAGRTEEALENLKKAETGLQEMGMDYWLGRTRELLQSLRA